MLEQTMTSQGLSRSVFKILLFFVVGGLAAFSLFALMAHFAYNSDTSVIEPQKNLVVEMLSVPEDRQTEFTEQRLPEPPTRPQKPPKPEPIDNRPVEKIALNTLDIDVSVGEFAISGIDLTGPTEGDAVPIVRVRPKIPIEAIRNGIDGWVTLSFTIDELGGVTDVNIMEAAPENLFEDVAKKALKKWKYKPRLENGKAVSQPNQTVMLEFNLSKR